MVLLVYEAKGMLAISFLFCGALVTVGCGLWAVGLDVGCRGVHSIYFEDSRTKAPAISI